MTHTGSGPGHAKFVPGQQVPTMGQQVPDELLAPNPGYQRPPPPERHHEPARQEDPTPRRQAILPADLPTKLYWYLARLQPTDRYEDGIVDGDTMHVTVDFGFYTYLQKSMRVANVNCPEIRDPGTPDNPYPGRAAQQYARDWFMEHAEYGFYVHTHLDPEDKYGRILAVIYGADGACYNDDVVTAGHAVPFEAESYD